MSQRKKRNLFLVFPDGLSFPRKSLINTSSTSRRQEFWTAPPSRKAISSAYLVCDDLNPGGGLSEVLTMQSRASPRALLSFYSCSVRAGLQRLLLSSWCDFPLQESLPIPASKCFCYPWHDWYFEPDNSSLWESVPCICRLFSSILGLYPFDVSSILPSPTASGLWQPKMSLDIAI